MTQSVFKNTDINCSIRRLFLEIFHRMFSCQKSFDSNSKDAIKYSISLIQKIFSNVNVYIHLLSRVPNNDLFCLCLIC